MTQNIEYLAGNIESYVTNALSGNRKTIWHPSKENWDCLRTAEPTLTTENAQLIFKFPIEQIVSFYVRCKVRYTGYDNSNNVIGTNTDTFTIDLSDFIYEKKDGNYLMKILQ